MNTSHDISAEVIAQLVASYNQPTMPQAQRLVKVQSAKPLPSKLAQVKAAKAAAKETAQATTARDARPFVTAVTLPSCGTYTARAFCQAMNRATDRDSKIIAIAGYAGYDVTDSFGAQEQRAMTMARHELRGAPKALTAPVHSKVAPTLAGFVSGIPQPEARRALDLAAREQLAATALADHLYRNSHPLAFKLAEVEQERLTHIRSELGQS